MENLVGHTIFCEILNYDNSSKCSFTDDKQKLDSWKVVTWTKDDGMCIKKSKRGLDFKITNKAVLKKC